MPDDKDSSGIYRALPPVDSSLGAVAQAVTDMREDIRYLVKGSDRMQRRTTNIEIKQAAQEIEDKRITDDMKRLHYRVTAVEDTSSEFFRTIAQGSVDKIKGIIVLVSVLVSLIGGAIVGIYQIIQHMPKG